MFISKNLKSFKILHLINDDDKNRGGAQKILSLLTNSSNTGTLTLKDSVFKSKFTTIVLQFIGLLFSPFSSKPKVVYIHSRCYIPFSLIFRLYRVKVVFYCHANYRFHGWLFRIFKCDAYLAVSSAVIDNLCSHGITRNKIVLIQNPLLLDISEEPMPVQVDLNFGSIGSLRPWKGFSEAAVLLDNSSVFTERRYNYKIVGEGELRTNLEAKSKQLKRGDLNLEGFSSEPFKKLQNFPFIIIPSLEEGFGLVAIESMVNNKIIIYSDTPALVELCEQDAMSFKFSVANQKSFNEAISQALNLLQKENIVELNHKRKHHIKTEFSFDKYHCLINNFEAELTREK